MQCLHFNIQTGGELLLHLLAEPAERRLPEKKLGGPLILPDLAQGYGPGMISPGLAGARRAHRSTALGHGLPLRVSPRASPGQLLRARHAVHLEVAEAKGVNW